MAVGYIVVEPDLHIERVPDRLLGFDALLWPPLESVPEREPLEPVQFFNAADLSAWR